jgi:hypothetical protein
MRGCGPPFIFVIANPALLQAAGLPERRAESKNALDATTGLFADKASTPKSNQEIQCVALLSTLARMLLLISDTGGGEEVEEGTAAAVKWAATASAMIKTTGEGGVSKQRTLAIPFGRVIETPCTCLRFERLI